MPQKLVVCAARYGSALIAQQRWEELRTRLNATHVSDIADMLTTLPPQQRAIVFRLVPRERASEVFGYLPHVQQRELIHSLSAAKTKLMLDLMRPVTAPYFSVKCPPRSHASCWKKRPEELK